MKYRPEVDGLRAVAVLPVILFHAGLPGFSGGYLGVDIFFVISGYLITTIIVAELEETGRFNLSHFYERRARRILPALCLTILMTLLIAPFALTPDQIRNVGQSIAATALFASNFFFYVEVDYFNPFASMAPLLHTWSLAVEEQFYLVFPLILLGVRWLRIPYGVLIGAIIAVSFALALWTTQTNPQLSFYAIHTRAWELAAGSAVALWLRSEDRANRRVSPDWVPALALLVLLGCLTLLPKGFAHPGVLTAIPVAATAVLIATLRPGMGVARVLTWRPIVHIGILSYGLYLYHNPLFSYIDVYFDYLGEGTRPYKLALIPLIYLLALASLRWVERPIRTTRKLGKTPILTGSAVALIGLFGVGAVIHLQNGFKNQIEGYYERQGMPLLVNVAEERQVINATRDALGDNSRPFDCVGAGCFRVLLIGDSLSDDAFVALGTHGQAAEYRRIYFDDTCMRAASDLDTFQAMTSCNNRPLTLGTLVQDAEAFIVTALWLESTYRDGYDFASMLRRETGKPVLVIGSAMFTNLGSFSIKAWRDDLSFEQFGEALWRHQRWDRLQSSRNLRDLVEADPALDWLDRHLFFCDPSAETCSLFDAAGGALIWDNAHLTPRAFAPYAQFVESWVRSRQETATGI